MKVTGPRLSVTWESEACNVVLAILEPKPSGRGRTQRPQNLPPWRRAVTGNTATQADFLQKLVFRGALETHGIRTGGWRGHGIREAVGHAPAAQVRGWLEPRKVRIMEWVEGEDAKWVGGDDAKVGGDEDAGVREVRMLSRLEVRMLSWGR